MKRIITFIFLCCITACSLAQKPLQYNNPILAGFYPDPSICRVGNDYYLVNSSFAYFPGLPIFHSTDLVNWQQVGNAIDRPGQLNLDSAGVSRGLFAPTLRYHNGLFYIICTLIDKGGNFVITAKDPKGPWSNPVWLKEVNGIDPSLFFDTDGKAYILFNSDAPNNKPLYDGHRSIRMFAFDPYRLSVTGEQKLLVNGGTDISKHPIWIEGPHLYQKDGWYYLVCAEGGTGDQHSAVVFRSKNIDGPYISFEHNPILTQRRLNPARSNPVTCTGHADLVQTKDSSWYAVFLGCRPYGDGYYNTGRETFMLPVAWQNGWPVILNDTAAVPYQYPVPMPALTKKVSNNFSGNLLYRDDFTAPQLNYRWLFLRTPKQPWYNLSKKAGLTMQLQPATCGGLGNPSFIAHRQQNIQCEAAVSLSFTAAADNEKAGLAIFQNENHYYYLCRSVNDKGPVVQLYQSTKDSGTALIAAIPLINSPAAIQLKIIANGSSYAFYFNTGSGWQLVKDKVDGTFISTKAAGGFVGSVFALYATSNGKNTSAIASYRWFQYTGNDAVYKK